MGMLEQAAGVQAGSSLGRGLGQSGSQRMGPSADWPLFQSRAGSQRGMLPPASPRGQGPDPLLLCICPASQLHAWLRTQEPPIFFFKCCPHLFLYLPLFLLQVASSCPFLHIPHSLCCHGVTDSSQFLFSPYPLPLLPLFPLCSTLFLTLCRLVPTYMLFSICL